MRWRLGEKGLMGGGWLTGNARLRKAMVPWLKIQAWCSTTAKASSVPPVGTPGAEVPRRPHVRLGSRANTNARTHAKDAC